MKVASHSRSLVAWWWRFLENLPPLLHFPVQDMRGGLGGSGRQAGWLQGRLRVFQGDEIRRSVEVET